MSPASGADHQDIARESGQAFDPPGGDIDRDEILDPNPHLALEIDPGLHGEDGRARKGRVGCQAPERRLFVCGQADPMAGPVTEPVAPVVSASFSSR